MNGDMKSAPLHHDGGRTPGVQRESAAGLFDRLRNMFVRSAPSVRHEIEGVLDEAANEADFTPQERTILKNVLGLHDVRVADVMVPRADVIAASAEATLGDLLDQFRDAGHSRLPVYGETLDDPKGMVHIRDLVDFLTAPAAKAIGEGAFRSPPTLFDSSSLARPLSSTKILRPILYAPPSMPALDLLVKMQASRTHMALVIDEYGGTDGLVSIEDVVEAIVGDIEDEHDEIGRPDILAASDGSFVAEARAGLKDVSAAVGFDLMALPEAEGIETIGGLLAAKVGRVPGRGEIVSGVGAFEFEVLDADPRRIKRVRIHPPTESSGKRAARRTSAGDNPLQPASAGEPPPK